MSDLAPPQAANITAPEQLFLDATMSGRRIDLAGETIRASMLRDLVIGSRSDWPLTQAGINLSNAVIQDALDLEGCEIGVPLVFQKCVFRPADSARSAISLRDARLRRIALYECIVEGALKADRCTIDSALFLTKSTIKGILRLRGARLGEALAMDEARIVNPNDTAIIADGMQLGGPWVLRAADIQGEVRFASARIGGGMLWEEASIKNNAVAVAADGVYCEGPFVLRRAKITGPFRLRGITVKAIDAQQITITAGSEAFNARGAEIGSDLTLDGANISGGVLLGRAHVNGELSAKGAKLAGRGQDWALNASGIVVGQGVSIMGAHIKGGIQLAGARIEQGLQASDITIDSTGRAIEADVMHVGGNWTMRGAKINGNVRFAGAQIDGQIGFTECDITGGGDLAIRADGSNVRGGWFMGRAKIQGLVRLPSARLGNEMRLRGTSITVASGPAIFASGVRIAREFVLDGGFTATGAIVLDRAEIDGTLDLTGSRIKSAAIHRNGTAAPTTTHDELLTKRFDPCALSLVDARLDRLVMPDTAEDRPRGIVDLTRAHVGSYDDDARAWPLPLSVRRSANQPDDHLVLDGFVYDHLETPTGLPTAATNAKNAAASRMRIAWLEGQSNDDLAVHFKPQAWVHLSKRLAAQGYLDDSREVAIARRRRQRNSASATRASKAQSWLLDKFALYGFNPWRTVLWMTAFVFMFAGVWWWAAQGCERDDCKDESVYVMALKGNYGQDDKTATLNYPGFSPLAYSLDVFLPFVNLGYKEHWRPKTNYLPIAQMPLPAASVHGQPTLQLSLGGILYVAYVLEMLLGLILASLAVTGFAGMLRGDDEGR